MKATTVTVPLVVDGNSLYARSHFAALSSNTFTDPAIGGVFLALQTVITLISPLHGKLNETPTHLLFCWDGAAKRDKQREAKTPEFMRGLELIPYVLQEVFGAANCFPEKEADDACATAVRKLELNPQISTIYVASGDKDLQQLASDKTAYYSLNEKAILGWSRISAKWGVKHPSQVGIALAIIGDKGDCIEGVRGWGPKKVTKLFEQVTETTSLDQVAELMAAGMNDEQLAAFQECLDLTLLHTDIPNVPDPAPIVIGGKDKLIEYGLGGIVPQLTILESNYDTVLQEDLG